VLKTNTLGHGKILTNRGCHGKNELGCYAISGCHTYWYLITLWKRRTVFKRKETIAKKTLLL
jgi:hypothetical protein